MIAAMRNRPVDRTLYAPADIWPPQARAFFRPRLPVAGVTWTAVRRDSAPSLSLVRLLRTARSRRVPEHASSKCRSVLAVLTRMQPAARSTRNVRPRPTVREPGASLYPGPKLAQEGRPTAFLTSTAASTRPVKARLSAVANGSATLGPSDRVSASSNLLSVAVSTMRSAIRPRIALKDRIAAFACSVRKTAASTTVIVRKERGVRVP